MRRLALAIGLGLTAFGCAAKPIPIEPALRVSLRKEPRVDAFVAPPRPFEIESARFAPGGGWIGVGRGAYLVVHGEEGGLYDPSLALREHFLAAIAGAGYPNVSARTDRFAGEEASPGGDGDAVYAFVFETSEWSLSSDYVSDLRHRLEVAFEARLERTEGGDLLWRDFARTGAETDSPDRTLREIFGDDMALLRRELERIAKECAEALAARFLEGPPAGP